MAGLDWVIIGLYFTLLLTVAWWVARRNRDTPDDYFLAGRNLGWFLAGASIFASNIGSEHFVVVAGGVATSGGGLLRCVLQARARSVLASGSIPLLSRRL